MTDQPTQRTRIECTTWHSPLFFVVPDGIEVRCRSCRGFVHHFKRTELERIWAEFAVQVKGATMAEKQEV